MEDENLRKWQVEGMRLATHTAVNTEKAAETPVEILIAVNNTNKMSVLHLMWQLLTLNVPLFTLR